MSNKKTKVSVVASSGTKQDDYWDGSLEKALLGASGVRFPNPLFLLDLDIMSISCCFLSLYKSLFDIPYKAFSIKISESEKKP